MGNIRPRYIKRVSHELILKHGEKFTLDFETNKRLVGELTDVAYKPMRNRIAGYATRLKKRQLKTA